MSTIKATIGQFNSLQYDDVWAMSKSMTKAQTIKALTFLGITETVKRGRFNIDALLDGKWYGNVDPRDLWIELVWITKPEPEPVSEPEPVNLDQIPYDFDRVYPIAEPVNAPAPLDYFNDYQFPNYGLDQDILLDLEPEPVNLDQIPYDFDRVYPIAEPVKPSQLYFDWSPVYDAKPEPVTLSYAAPTRFDLVDLEPEPSFMDRFVLLVDGLETALDIFTSPLIIAPMYFAIALLFARVFFGL